MVSAFAALSKGPSTKAGLDAEEIKLSTMEQQHQYVLSRMKLMHNVSHPRVGADCGDYLRGALAGAATAGAIFPEPVTILTGALAGGLGAVVLGAEGRSAEVSQMGHFAEISHMASATHDAVTKQHRRVVQAARDVQAQECFASIGTFALVSAVCSSSFLALTILGRTKRDVLMRYLGGLWAPKVKLHENDAEAFWVAERRIDDCSRRLSRAADLVKVLRDCLGSARDTAREVRDGADELQADGAHVERTAEPDAGHKLKGTRGLVNRLPEHARCILRAVHRLQLALQSPAVDILEQVDCSQGGQTASLHPSGVSISAASASWVEVAHPHAVGSLSVASEQ